MPQSIYSQLHDAYAKQRHRAGARGIGWALSFEQWCRIWLESGRIDQRGIGAGEFCMARMRDAGPYEAGNVQIKTNRENTLESYEFKPHVDRPGLAGERPRGSAGGGAGVSFRSASVANPWIVRFRGSYLGRFPTKQAARAVYVKAAIDYLTSVGKPIPDSLKA